MATVSNYHFKASSKSQSNRGMSTSAMQRFSHTTLKSRTSIRLLQLLPSSSYEDPLKCDLFECDLSDGEGYQALSYAWDAQIPTSTILCNDRVLGITQNCELALRRLRKAHWPRTLWIDSICIDQTSLRERSIQVDMMDQIYGLADCVIVWLGEGDERSYEAMDFISQWTSNGPPATSSDHRQLCLTLGNLLYRSWFRRMWTIQELMLGKETEVMCGPHQMSWVSFREGIAQAAPVIDQHGGGYFNRIFPGFALLDALKTPILAIPCRTYGLPLSDVLRLVRMRACSDPKDRIYALYGIFRRQGLRLPAPDYEKTVRQIYTEAAKAAITHANSLELLSQLSCRSITDTLPSWVPDLTQRPWFPANEPPVVPNIETRSGKIWFTFSDDSQRLHVSASVFDEIAPDTHQLANVYASFSFLLQFPGAFVTRNGQVGFRAVLQDEDPLRTPYKGDLIVIVNGVSSPLIIRQAHNETYSIICSAYFPRSITEASQRNACTDLRDFVFM